MTGTNDESKLDKLNGRVTEAIFEADRLSDADEYLDAAEAYIRIARIEEEIATLICGSKDLNVPCHQAELEVARDGAPNAVLLAQIELNKYTDQYNCTRNADWRRRQKHSRVLNAEHVSQLVATRQILRGKDSEKQERKP